MAIRRCRPEGAATLESTGLAPAEALAYRTLLRSPAASARDLAGRLGMSVLDARTALHGLEAKGLIGRMPGAAQRFRVAASPDEAFRPLIRRRRADLRAMRSDVDALAEEYRSGRSARSGERVEMLAGDVAAHVARLVAGATADVCALVTNATQALPAIGRGRLGGGVVERTVYPRSALGRPDDRREIEAAIRGGAQIRVTDRPPFAMLVVDRSLVLVSTTSVATHRLGGRNGDPAVANVAAVDVVGGSDAVPGAVVVHPGGLQDSLVAIFDRTWATAEPVRVTAGGLACGDPSVTVPCPDDLRLLTLLLDGLTDEAIATKLDLGTRTVQRRVRELIESAGVRTRLQLIWQATRRGWI